MTNDNTPRFRIYPSIGVARLGNGPARKEHVVWSPEVPWKNLYDTNLDFLTADGQLKKMAQRFYVYECDEEGRPAGPVSLDDYEITWTVEVANKKPFWYDFNNCLDLSIVSTNENVSPEVALRKIAPGISTQRRNPNVLDRGHDYRKELVNHPDPVSVSSAETRLSIMGQFPSASQRGGLSHLAASMKTTAKPVQLGTLEYDDGTLIFYGADGISASLNPSDLNTDFADNSNWYDDICDGRVTARLVSKKDGTVHELSDASSAAWIVTAPPNYAPQIDPISTLYDLIVGAANPDHPPCLSLVFPLMYRMYRMQWVNLGDFLAPSFKETIDELTAEGKLRFLYVKEPAEEASAVRESIFQLFRNPAYPPYNEPVIPSAQQTDIKNRGVGTAPLKLPYYPGDGIDYPGSAAQWFAVPPLLYKQLERWRDGDFETPPGLDARTIDELGAYYQRVFLEAADDPSKCPLLMTRAVLETLYGGGFHPGVELTWPMRHNEIYAENSLVHPAVLERDGHAHGLFGLREIRLRTSTKEQQDEIFYNDFGLRMDSNDIRESLDPASEKHWLWLNTPGDLTKWMGIPWQSDAGSCQAVFVEEEYPVPAWWAANLPVYVLTGENYEKLKDSSVLDATRRSIYATRTMWLQTTDTGFVGYHAEGGYQNGLISMVYQWKSIAMVTGRSLDGVDIEGIPKVVYVALNGKQRQARAIAEGIAKSVRSVPEGKQDS